MPVEALIEEYNKQKTVILSAMKKQTEIIEKISSADDEQFDWIPVKVAAERLSVSPQYLYTRRDLEQKRIGSKIYLRWSECKAINDKYEVEA